jgi:hypothetical protein
MAAIDKTSAAPGLLNDVGRGRTALVASLVTSTSFEIVALVGTVHSLSR